MSLVTPNYRKDKHDLQFAKVITDTLAVFMKYFAIKTVKDWDFSHGKMAKKKKKENFTPEQAEKAQRGSRGIVLHFLEPERYMGWVVKARPRPLYPRESHVRGQDSTALRRPVFSTFRNVATCYHNGDVSPDDRVHGPRAQVQHFISLFDVTNS